MATWTASVANRWVQLRVTAVETGVSTANNTSKVRVSTEIYYPGGSSTFDSWAQTLTVSVNGTQIGQQTGITYSLSTSNRTRTLNTYTSDAITHNSDGSKTVNVRVNYAGQPGVVNTTISQSLRLTTIPRATTLSAFSFGSSLRDGYSNTIKYTVDKKSSSFRNQIQLRDGSTTVFTWDNQNTDGSNSITLKASEVNTLLNRMSTTTSKSFTLRVATRSGHNGGWVGSAVSMNATATVNSNVAPTASGMSTEIHGSGHDNSIGKYVQGITRVTASFDGGAGYGASITSRNITIRRVSGGSDTQTIGAASGTTPRAVNLSGTYEALGTITDSRGRTSPTARTTFTVEAYSSPTINNFTANRNEDAQTLVNISISGRHSHLDGGNRLSYTIQRRQGTGSWVNVSSGATGSSVSATFSRTASSSGNSVASSYEFRVVAEDQFGGRVGLVRSVSTQRVVLDIHKDEGVGIGKIHEQGVLDVDGEAHFKGDLFVNGTKISTAQAPTAWSTITGKPTTATRWPSWGEVTSKPTTATRWPKWSEVTSKPSTFAPSSHTHKRSQTQLRGATNIASGRTYSLSQSIRNFDLIVIHYSTVYTSSTQYNADTLTLYPHGHPTSGSSTMSIGYGSTGRWVGWQFTSTTNLKCTALSNTVSPRIRAVYGIKFTA